MLFFLSRGGNLPYDCFGQEHGWSGGQKIRIMITIATDKCLPSPGSAAYEYDAGRWVRVYSLYKTLQMAYFTIITI